MVRLRIKYLSCFYCGRRSTIQSDTRVREFLCTNCEAKNHLDENGEITDPPVNEISSPKQYAVASRAPSPTNFPSASFTNSFTSSSDTIFCDTCLKNQRLFTASLAQYLPDDPSHPDYADLERKYYRFRKDLEKRYPQVCADCAGKVESRIRQAGYTAKTDHLRLMMEKSRSRNVPKRMTPLDVANMVGRWIWWGGLLLQTLWHLANVARALQQQFQEQQQQQHSEGMYDPDEKKRLTDTLTAHLGRGMNFLPNADALIFWSISAGLLSAWWNPHFVQLARGFTRHLVGFTQWYSFQGLIVFLRYLFRNVVAMQGGRAQSRQAQLSAHLVMATIMCFIYSLAKGSIKVDTSPLFGPSEKTATLPLDQITPARKRREEPKTLAEELTEALDAATPARIAPTPKQEPLTRRDNSLLSTPRLPSTPFRASREASPFASSKFHVRSQSPIKSDRKPNDPDAMDWSPIPVPAHSTHRAFQTPTPKAGPRPFGQSPTQPNANAFWFKVPPAPVNPAQRLRNPPNAPFLRQKQEPSEEERAGLPFKSKGADQNLRGNLAAPGDRVDFQQPSFFAPERSDETSGLADVFSSSFSLGAEGMESDDGDTVVEENASLPPSSRSTLREGSSLYELYTVAALLPSWVLLSLTSIPYRTEMQLVCLGLAGFVALQSVGGERSTSKSAGHILSTLSVAELGAICWALGQVWSEEQPLASVVPWYGAGTLGLMLGHQGWLYLMQ